MKKVVYSVILIIATLIYFFLFSLGAANIFDGEEEAWLIIIPAAVGLVSAFIVFKKKWYGALIAIIPAVFCFANCFTDNGWKNDFPEITAVFSIPLVLLLAIIPVVNKLKHEPKKVKTKTETQNTSENDRVSYTGVKYAVLLLFATIAQSILFFLPWLKLERDVYPYMFHDIPKISSEALRFFSNDLFIIPNLFLWATVVTLALAIIFQLAEIIPVFSGKRLNKKCVKRANFFTIATCVCPILMFVTFWIFLFFGFFPRVAMIIIPFAVLCQILFAKKCRPSE